jgi:filamentous hemagglutinin family protein
VLLPCCYERDGYMDESTARSRPPDSMRQAFLWALLPTLVLVLNAPDPTYAQVATNITASGLGTEVPLQPPSNGAYNITGGTRANTNLFHSFGQFSVGAGDVANFQNTQVNDAFPATSNILSRVTGGNPSQIYGTIQTTDFPGANLFLMNPAGVLFGATAVLDLGAVTGSAVREPGSFYATTADYLNLVDDNGTSHFYADPAQTSVLSVAPVVAFGFLEPNAGSIAIQGGNLEVPDGQTLSFIGGPRVFTPDTGVTVPSGVTMTAGRLSAPNGLIYMETVTAPGEIPLPTLSGNPLGSPVSFPGSENAVIYVQSGELVMKGASLLTATTGPTSGEPIDIDVEVTGQFTMQNVGTLSSSTTGEGQAGAINVSASTLTMDASSITTETSGDGNAGHITANVGTLSLDNGATINSNNLSIGTDLDGDGMADVTGVGGNVTIQGRTGAGSAADSVTLNHGAVIKTETSGLGRGGDVSITADKMQMDNMSEVPTGTFFGGGVGGDLSLNVGTLTLNGGSAIRTTDFTFGTDFDFDGVVDAESTGSGGHVTIQGAESAAEFVVLSGGSQIVSESLDGNGGRLSIAATSMNLDGASTINSGTFGRGHGGDIEIRVQNASLSGGSTLASSTASDQPPGKGVGGTITVQRLEGQGSKAADSLTLTGFRSGIITDSFGSALPGDVGVHAKMVNLTDGAVIEGGTRLSDATGGIVTIDAESVGIIGGSHISSQARAQDAGQVTIRANELTLDNGSIETTTISDIGGRGGDVVLDVGTVSLTNGASINSQSEPFSTGRAGDITITAEQSATLTNGSSISASSTGTGNAGDITIQSGSTVVLNNSSMTTEAKEASGGQIEINAPEMVRLINSQVSTSVEDGTGGGGNITIDPQFVILQNSTISANAFGGSGGAINVTAGVFLADPNSVVEATSQQGPQGTVNIQSPVKNLGEQLTPLSQQFSSAAALLAQRCAARVADGKFSTFVVASREGLPVEPGGFLASPSLTAELFGSGLSGRYPHTPIAAVTGSFPEYDARPIQLAKFGDACH